MVSDGENGDKKEKRRLLAVSPIAKPLAGKKLCKRTLKVIRLASDMKQLKRGVKEVVKFVRRGKKGLCVIAGDISPIDVITHVPVLCEEADIPYIYVPSKEDLASASITKRPTCCVLVMSEPQKGEVKEEEKAKFIEDFDKVVKEVRALTASYF
ncbi:hypothetical protein KP509_32G020300 [Ceratopteris richardii]|uniref:H/ACA ribonucleoprotein complex subunit 2 n=1 Tax=Ceratopteris richardii TaxID=49495 RepID=A0A8T2QS57_CERRI|nr:hypothetical protein KP509_32G020300 [Ceratopteris richardii]